jgi:hypothetical protein
LYHLQQQQLDRIQREIDEMDRRHRSEQS